MGEHPVLLRLFRAVANRFRYFSALVGHVQVGLGKLRCLMIRLEEVISA